VNCTPAVSVDGSRIAYGSQHFVYCHWTDDPDRWVVDENDSTHQFTGLAFHPSGRYLAATNNDETVKLYDTQSWELAKTYTWDIGRMRSIAFSPDGTLAAAGSDTGKVVVWDVDL
jgi:WD40 repeat protein